MNRIRKLLDEKYLRQYFAKHLLPLYPEHDRIKSIVIKPHKKMIWETTYHVVFEYEIMLRKTGGNTDEISVFCTAHSNEARKSVHDSLQLLWDKGFPNDDFHIPRPLFYSPYFHAAFYRGLEGRNIFYFIKHGMRDDIDEIIPHAAALFARLHDIRQIGGEQINKKYSRIKSINSGARQLISRIQTEYSDFYPFYKESYAKIIRHENDFFRKNPSAWLIHGDAHPENIIRLHAGKTGLIDFTDLSYADFARDLGSFAQQLDYMIGRKMEDLSYAKKCSACFLESYFKHSPARPYNEDIQNRIDIYYAWTAIRTATYFLLKAGPEPARAQELVNIAANILKIT